MGTETAPPPEQCATTAKTSEWERAGHKKGGAGGIPPRLFASGLSLEKAWIPRPGPGGNHLAGANLRRSQPDHLPTATPAERLREHSPPEPVRWAGPPSPRGEGFGGGKEAFHLGYRAALHTLKAAVGHDAVTGMLHDILLTEYDLGVLRTSMEQERIDAAAPPEE